MLDLKALLTKILANYADIRKGTVSASTVGSISANGGYKDVTIQFTPQMKSTPIIIPIRTSIGTVGYQLQFGAINISTNGCTIRVWNFGSAAVSPAVAWVAIAI